MKRVLPLIYKAEEGIVSAELAVMVVSLAVMLASILVNVIARTFNLPVPDLSEPALISMASLAFIGSAYAVYASGHIAVDLGDLIPLARWRDWSEWVVDFAVVALSVLVLVYGSEFLAFVVSISEGTPGLGLPLALPVGCLIGGAGLSVVHVACRCARRLAGGSAVEKPRKKPIAVMGEEKAV